MNSFCQVVVRFNEKSLSVLQEKGYENLSNLTLTNYSFTVIIVDVLCKTFYGTNTACMAAMKPKVYGIEEIIEFL